MMRGVLLRLVGFPFRYPFPTLPLSGLEFCYSWGLSQEFHSS